MFFGEREALIKRDVSSQTVERAIMWSKKLLVGLVACGLLVVGIAGAGRWLYNREMYRLGVIGSYAAALEHYRLEGMPPPASLQQLINCYNAYDRRLTCLPPDPEWPLPLYRPAGHLKGGPYIVFVEGPPPRWYDSGKFIIYATPEGHVTFMSLVLSAELEELLKKDDLLRAEEKADPDPEK